MSILDQFAEIDEDYLIPSASCNDDIPIPHDMICQMSLELQHAMDRHYSNTLSPDQQFEILHHLESKYSPTGDMSIPVQLSNGPIGAGVSAEIFHVQIASQSMAAKRFKLAGSRTLAKFLRSIDSEVEIMRKFNHPHILQPFGIAWSASPTLFMPFYQSDLWSVIKAETFTNDQITCILAKLLSALNHCHRQGIVHGDIKPQNILWNSMTDFVLTDFGSAVDKTNLTQPSSLFTEQFASPALALGACISEQSDLYALGCTVLTMITQELPWPKAENYSIFPLLAQNKYPNIPHYVDASIKEIIVTLLKSDQRVTPEPNQTYAEAVANCLNLDITINSMQFLRTPFTTNIQF